MQHCVIADNPSDNALLPPPSIVRDMNTFRARVENSGSCPVVLDGGTVDAVSRPNFLKQSITNCPTSTPSALKGWLKRGPVDADGADGRM